MESEKPTLPADSPQADAVLSALREMDPTDPNWIAEKIERMKQDLIDKFGEAFYNDTANSLRGIESLFD